MTQQERIQTASSIFQELQPLMINLYSRWQDEKEHEEIADYGAVIAKKIAGRATFLKMQKRPFGFTALIADGTYCYTVGGQKYSYKRIA